ncbi:MAG: ATP-binding protein [Anaerovoracaceae bacterium]
MNKKLFKLNGKLNRLSVFRNILKTDVAASFRELISAIESGNLDMQLSCYGAFANAVYSHGGNLTDFVLSFLEVDENMFLVNNIDKTKPISDKISASAENELDVLQEFADITPKEIQNLINYDDFLPEWENRAADIREFYRNMLSSLSTKGYGIFAKYKAFKVKNGELVPVKNSDSQTVEQLYGYTRERNQVIENTRALAEGKPASNVLLYGDAGTGKSSTIKAAANAFYDRGVRLIEFDKYQLSDIPAIIDRLSSSPLKFIFYIDDLSFEANDDAFSSLKGILEGNVTSYSKNIAVYATSNRRHLVKESMEARTGNDLHLNDTLQETMSLSARFGLTITFSKPEKDLYLEIVKSLAEEYGIEADEAELFRKAEAFAIRSNGRSPRTAKQFIQLVSIGIK